MSVELIDRDWNTAISAGLGRDASSFRVICPFVKKQVLTRLINEHELGQLRLITRLNLADFADGVSDLSALRAVLDAGGDVRGVRDLHAKVFLFGGTRAAVTSANLTRRGLTSNHEFGCISEETAFVHACSEYFDSLWDAAKADVTREQLDEWDVLVDEHLDSGARPAAAAALPDFGATVTATATALPDLAPRGWPAESGQAFVKFFGQGSNRADYATSILGEVKRSGCHWACTYPADKRPRAVRDGDTIFVARLVRAPDDTIIFGRVIGREHRDGHDDATPQEIALRPFKEKWPHYIRVHHGQFLAGTLQRHQPGGAHGHPGRRRLRKHERQRCRGPRQHLPASCSPPTSPRPTDPRSRDLGHDPDRGRLPSARDGARRVTRPVGLAVGPAGPADELTIGARPAA